MEEERGEIRGCIHDVKCVCFCVCVSAIEASGKVMCVSVFTCWYLVCLPVSVIYCMGLCVCVCVTVFECMC